MKRRKKLKRQKFLLEDKSKAFFFVKISGMKPFLLLGVLALLPFAARANDSSFEGVGGTMRPTKGENQSVRMKSEVVVLTAGKEDFSTRADFVFGNETDQSQTVPMGFPEGNFGDVSAGGPLGRSGFKGFATWVDGNRVVAKRTVLKDADSSGFDTYWLKTVVFAPRQTRRVRVEFRSPYGGNTNWGYTRAMSYAFTGKNWRGKVGESKLEVRLTQPGLWRAVASGQDEKVLPMSLQSDARGATFRRTWKNWEADESFLFGLERAVPFWRKDTGGNDSGAVTMATVAATQTVRVGPKPKTLESTDGFPADGFSRGGVLYVGVDHLANRLETWGYDEKPRRRVNLILPANGFDLSAGKSRLQGREGATTMRVNGSLLELGAPIVAIPRSGTRLFYVPIAPVARKLGWQVALRGERLFTLTRGSWRG